MQTSMPKKKVMPAFPWLRPPSEGFGPTKYVHNIADAFKWCRHALDRIVGTNMCTPADLARVLGHNRGRTITTSECFAGVGTGCVADDIISKTSNAFIQDNAEPQYDMNNPDEGIRFN